MAYLLPVEKPRCSECPKPATVYAYNRFNARNGAFCTRHGEAYVKALDVREKSAGSGEGMYTK